MFILFVPLKLNFVPIVLMDLALTFFRSKDYHQCNSETLLSLYRNQNNFSWKSSTAGSLFTSNQNYPEKEPALLLVSGNCLVLRVRGGMRCYLKKS